MNTLNKIIIATSMLLALAPTVHLRHIEFQFPREKLLDISNDSITTFIGSGTKENHLPIVECAWRRNPYQFNCTVHLRTGESCKLKLGNERTVSAVARDIYQLTENKVIVVWRQYDRTHDNTRLTINPMISTIDMKSCVVSNVLSFPYEDFELNMGINVLIYEDGFDVIFNGVISSYDLDGYQIDEAKPFLFNSTDNTIRSIDAPSYKSRFGNFFVVGQDHRSKASVSLVDRNGMEIEELMSLQSDDIANNGNESLYTICYTVNEMNATTTIECHQFNGFGLEVYRDTMNIDGYHIFYRVANSKHGGVVIFTVNEDWNMLHVISKQADGEVVVSSHSFDSKLSIPTRFISCCPRLVNFNEDDNSFTLAYETKTELEHAVVLQKYRLAHVIEDLQKLVYVIT